jgi:tetratricopeptide (TPR) repeat protein
LDRQTNFGFLAERDRRLFISGMYAEEHLYLDPNASMVHARQFGERLAEMLWTESGLGGNAGTFAQRVEALHAHGVFGQDEYDLFTDIRRTGNRAVHEQWDNKADALRVLQACHALGRWLHHTAPPFVPPALSRAARPRQLPPRRPTFAGRRDELARLDRLLETAAQPGSAVVAAIVGTAGIGKTTLALHWAHEAHHHFPDGQLYVDLRGFDPGEPVATAHALHGFLHALGVPAAGMPNDTAARAEVYRGLIAGRRMLIVLDNARSSADVTPLLPNASTCMVVVTSRDRLHGLVVRNGADRIELAPMSTVGSLELLAQRLTRARVDAEPEAAADLAAECAHLPLALSIAGASHPGLPLRDLVKRLRDSKLDALDLGADGLDVRAVFSWSYHQLSTEAARLFRQLGHHPGPDFDPCVCAALLGDADARVALTELANANLVEEHRPGRFRCHDLLRGYAAELAGDRGDAKRRMIGYYITAARVVNSRIQPCWDERHHELPIAHNYPQVSNYADAMAWFAAEHATLRAMLDVAGRRGYGVVVEDIARGCAVYLARTGQRRERVALRRATLTIARDSGYAPAIIVALRELARALVRLGEFAEAIGHLDEAFDLAARHGAANDRIAIHLNYSLALHELGQHADALHHAQRAAAITRGPADLRYHAGVLTAVARQLACLGDNAGALPLCEEGRDFYARVRNHGGEAQALTVLGLIHQNLGHDDAAIACYEQALELDRRINAPYWEATVLERLGERHEAAGHPDRARDAREQAAAIRIALR